MFQYTISKMIESVDFIENLTFYKNKIVLKVIWKLVRKVSCMGQVVFYLTPKFLLKVKLILNFIYPKSDPETDAFQREVEIN